MKTAFILFSLFCIGQVFAAGKTPLQKGDVALTQAEAELVSVKQICPGNGPQPTCDAFGSKARIRVTLNGCHDRLGGHYAKFNKVDGRGVLSFGALNIHNKASREETCLIAPVVFLDIAVPFEGEVELEKLDFKGTVVTHDQSLTVLSRGDLSLHNANVTILSTNPICQSQGNRPTCAAIGSKVRALVYLNGCMDKMGGHFYQVQQKQDGRVVISVGALSIHNEQSTRALCNRIPTKEIEFYIPFEKNLAHEKIEFVGTKF